MSVDYYTRLERGNLGRVSKSVLDALARALQLDEAERAHLFDRGLQDLVGELSTRSQAFRARWAANVRHHHTGRKHLYHPVVGDLRLTYEVLELPADPGLSLVVYGAEPGSASQDGLRLLASWAATLDLDLDQPDETQPAPASEEA